MQVRHGVPLAGYTSLRLGGPARDLVEAETEDELVAAVAATRPALVLAGGTNLVIADAGVDGPVVRVATRGVQVTRDDDAVLVTAQAGEPWDALVARAVDEGWAGVEALSGIPGTVGAAPVQNVGAYGQELAGTLSSVRVLDRPRATVTRLSAEECGLGYRTSAFRHSDRYVVLSVSLRLRVSRRADPVGYAELADRLGVHPGQEPSTGEVREAVLTLRRAKGMVADPDDPDTVSVGSFFVNPVLDTAGFAALAERVAVRFGPDAGLPAHPDGAGRVKTSAAWLIERAGFPRGYALGAAAISGKHTLALVNRGGASAADLLHLARTIRDGVAEVFAVELRPEPVIVGDRW